MKRLMVIGAMICISHLVTAQTSSKDTIPPGSADTSGKKMGNDDKNVYIMMQAGKMLMVENGKSAPLKKVKILSNGTIVMTDGSVRTTDGNVVKLKEGDRVYLDGRLAIGGKDL